MQSRGDRSRERSEREIETAVRHPGDAAQNVDGHLLRSVRIVLVVQLKDHLHGGRLGCERAAEVPLPPPLTTTAAFRSHGRRERR